MKTSEQIADDVLADHAIKPHWQRSGEQIAALLAEAVEADRAQRAVIDPDWVDDQANVRDSDHVTVGYCAWDERGRVLASSDMTLTPAQAVGMFQGIGEAS